MAKGTGMKAYVLRLGEMKSDYSGMLSGINAATPARPDPKITLGDESCYGVLIDHPTAGKILYDTGVGPTWPQVVEDGFAPFFGPGETMEEQLALCGCTPKDVSTVILSHLHWDHTGNLPLFEHCDVYASEKELQFGLTAIHRSPDERVQHPYTRADLDHPYKSYTGVLDEEESYELFPGVHVINTPGHTIGHLALLLELDGGNVLFTGDSIFLMKNFEVVPGFCLDNTQWLASRRRILKFAKMYDAAIFAGHDINQLVGEMKKAPDFYS